MHRDIKPENIVLRKESNTWVLVDFGLAAFTDQSYLYDKCGIVGCLPFNVEVENYYNRKYIWYGITKDECK